MASSKCDSANWYELRMPSSRGTCFGNTSWSSYTMSLPPGAPHTAIPPVQPMPSTLPDGNQSIGAPFHQGQEQTSGQSTPTPMLTTGLDINKLEERLGEVMNKKLESITETLKSSLSNNMENSSMAPSTASPKAPGPLVQTGSGLPLSNVQDGITAAPPVPVAPEVQPPAELPMLTSKAKPPSRTEETLPSYTTSRPTRTSSKKRSRPRRSKDRKPSRSSSSNRRSLHRRRARSRRHHRRDHASASPGSRHQDRSPHRGEASPRPPKTAFTAGRDLSHPIDQRSNAMRKRPSASATEGFRQVHTDPHTTVYARSN